MNEQHEVGTIELAAWFCGERQGARAERIAAHVAGCLLCRNRLETLRREKEQFLRAMPSAPPAALAAAGAAPRGAAWRPLYAVAAALVVALGAGVALRAYRPAGAVRTKGAVAVRMYVLEENGKPGERATGVYHPGERVQLTYSCGTENRLILLSIDTAGRTTVYYPAQGDTSITLEPGHDRPLPNSIELDSYLGQELFVAWFTARAATVGTVKSAVEAAFRARGALDSMAIAPSGGAVVRSILISKQERPQ